MATHKDKLIELARNAKRSGMSLDQLTKGAKPWAAEILEKEFTRFKPRKLSGQAKVDDEIEDDRTRYDEATGGSS